MLRHFAVVLLLLEVHNIFITSIEDGAAPKLADCWLPHDLEVGQKGMATFIEPITPSV